MDYNLSTDAITIKEARIITLSNNLVLITTDGSLDLNVEISADLSEVPENYREVFINMLTSKYLGKVSFGANPFSQCKPPRRRKWWEFWKHKWVVQYS